MAWLNSDDKYHRDAFYKVAYLFDSSPGVEWLTGHPAFWGKEGEFTHVEPSLPTYCRQDFLEGRYNQPFIQQESTFWKRSLWERAGGCLRVELDYAGDLELWIRFFRFALLHSVDTFIGGYRGHGNQKACLFMDRYVAEAESVIAQEKELHGEQYTSMSPAAPTPLEFDICGYREYLVGMAALPGSAKLMAATEEVFQYLLRKSAVNLVGAEERDRLLLEVQRGDEQIHALHNSLSWRITRPLRWMLNLVRR